MTPKAYRIGDADTRPWGRWVVLDLTPHLVVKKPFIAPGKRISLQLHRFRSERWIMMQGEAVVQKNEEEIILKPGDGVLIPQNTLHRLSNESEQEVLLLEVQFGDLLSEDDIERLEDDYGRKE